MVKVWVLIRRGWGGRLFRRRDGLLDVIGVFQAFALPQPAFIGIVIVLVGDDLLETLNVAVDAAHHVVVGLLAAGVLVRGAWLSAFGVGEVAVGVGYGRYAGEGG